MSNTEIRSLGEQTLLEIASQPELWAEALRRSAEEVAGLPEPGERVLILGCGTSFYIAQAYARLRESGGAGVTDAVIASDAVDLRRAYDRILVISRSGTTTEVIEALREQPSALPVTAVLGELGTPLESLADHVIDLSFADEASVVQTRFPTTLLTFLRGTLASENGELRHLVSDAQSVLAEPVGPRPPTQLVVLATGWAAAVAQEAALKCREAAGLWVEAYPTGEYRHGPISAAGAGTLVWAMSGLSETEYAAIADTSATVRLGRHDPQVELVALQRHAVQWAATVGRDADRPAHLSRSVVQL